MKFILKKQLQKLYMIVNNMRKSKEMFPEVAVKRAPWS